MRAVHVANEIDLGWASLSPPEVLVTVYDTVFLVAVWLPVVAR